MRTHPDAPPDSAQRWLERSAKLGYARAAEALHSGRPLLDREILGASDPTLLTAWVIECARKDNASELNRLGAASAAVRDEFGRGALSHAAAAGSLAAAEALLDIGRRYASGCDVAGTTALMIAAERPDAAMIDLLLQHGADPQATDAQQRTALFYAARANQPDHDPGACSAPAPPSMRAIAAGTTRSTQRSPWAPKRRGRAALLGASRQSGHNRPGSGAAANSMRHDRATSIADGRHSRWRWLATMRPACSSCSPPGAMPICGAAGRSAAPGGRRCARPAE